MREGSFALDSEIDVVLLDGDLTTPPAGELLGQVRSRRPGCQVGLLSSANVGGDVFRLDVDEYVPRPVTREEFRETVWRLVDRGEVMDIVETYLGLVVRKRRLEDRRNSKDLSEDDRYSELVGELAGRRHQLMKLLSQLAEADSSEADDSTVDPNSSSLADPTEGLDPLYRTRPKPFYVAWFAAALAYGVGDVVSTVYAVVSIPGVIEGNPVVNGLLQNFGLAGFVILKLLVFLILISVSVQGGRSRDPLSYYWPPVVMTGLGLVLTGWNLRLILGA